jgi:hypothetical protein
MSRILGTDPDGEVSEALAIRQLSVSAVLHNTGPMPFAGVSVAHILISGVALGHERGDILYLFDPVVWTFLPIR